jgi:ketosteroid isomerase-like protein
VNPDVDGFLARFFAFGAAPSVETYLPLFHPDATLFDSGMPRPLTVAEIPEHISATLALLGEFRMTPERWRLGGRTCFVEARNEALLGGAPVFWRSVYCVDLAGDRVIRGRRYYDRQPLFARLAPNVPELPAPQPELEPASLAPPAPPPDSTTELIARYADCWKRGAPWELAALYREDAAMLSPGFVRPLARGELASYYRGLMRALPDLTLELASSAGDGTLAFAEWRARATVSGRERVFGIADRFDLAAGRILSARAYFDSLGLLAPT